MKETRVKNFVLSQEADHSQVRGEDEEKCEGEGRDSETIGGI